MARGEKQPKDWAIITAVTFVVGIILLKLLNAYVEDFPLNTKTFIVVMAIGLILFGVIKILRYRTGASLFSKENIGYFIVWVTVIAAILFALIFFKIAPSFNIVSTNIASVVGL